MEQLSLNLEKEGMFERISSKRQLTEAFKAVRRNAGAAGIDGVTTRDFGRRLRKNISKLSEEVRNWTYKPQPVKRVRIPKPGSRKQRELGIPCVRDRVLQYSIKMSLEPKYEAKFSKSSFGFRPGRSQRDAVEHAKAAVISGKEWVVDIDLERFFDTVDQNRLLWLLGQEVDDKRVLRLIGISLRSGVVDNGRLKASHCGVIQGSPLSPLLSNVVLDELDEELEKRGLAFSRYADDSVIFVRTEKAAQRVKVSVSRFIEEKLKLKVNKEKSQVARSEKVKYLGMTIACGMIVISKKSMSAAMAEVKKLVKRRTHIPLKAQMARVNEWYRGWSGYFKMTETPVQLRQIEARIRVRFRVQFIQHLKRKRFLIRELKARGIGRDKAWRDVYSNSRTWALAHKHSIQRAWSPAWFVEQGQYSISGRQLRHWKSLKTWVKLT